MTVDAAGYRERREAALHRMADRAAAEALRYDRARRARADARAGAQDRAHLPERAHRRGDPHRGRRARSPARGQPGARPSAAPERFTGNASHDGSLLAAARRCRSPTRTRRSPIPPPARDVHVADSLSGLEVADLAARARGSPTSARAPGFPGLVLAVALPRARVDLIEAAGRKTAVIDRLIQAAQIGNARSVTARAEEWGRAPLGRGAYDAVTARAVAGLAGAGGVRGAAAACRGRACGLEGGCGRRTNCGWGRGLAAQVGLSLEEVLPVEPFAGVARPAPGRVPQDRRPRRSASRGGPGWPPSGRSPEPSCFGARYGLNPGRWQGFGVRGRTTGADAGSDRPEP